MICRITSKTLQAFVMIVAFMLLLTGGAGAVPVEEWNRTFGGPYWDAGHSVQQTPDGGYIIAGGTNLWGSGDFGIVWVIKTDANGIEQWNKTYAGSRWANKVIITSDKGYLLAGFAGDGPDRDFWLMKTDASGNEQWNRTLGGKGNDFVNSVTQTSDGGYTLAGLTSLSETLADWDVRLIKVDASGNEQWNMTSKRSIGDAAYSMQQTSDGGYILAGGTESRKGDALIIKTDAKGNQLWDRTFGDNGTEVGYSVQQTSDGGYILAGNTNSYGSGGFDAWLLKTDANGNEQWNRTFGGLDNEIALSIQKTSDSGYVFAGYTKSYGAGGKDVWVVKTDATGNHQWNKTFGGVKSDEAYSLEKTLDGGYILVGQSNWQGSDGDVWLIKIREPSASAIETTIADMNKPAEKSTPGFEIFGAMISIVILFYLMRKRT